MRRSHLLVAAALAATAAAGATAAVVLPDRPESTATLVQAPSGLVPGSAPEAGTPSPPASASASATASPEASETTRPGERSTPSAEQPAGTPRPDKTKKPEPTPSESADPGWYTNYGPRDPGSLTVPYVQGRTSWDVTNAGVRFRISMTPARVGVETTFTIEASSAADGCCRIQLMYSDGFTAGDTTCHDYDPSKTFGHVFNKAGVQELYIAAGTPETCVIDGPPPGQVFLPFDVAPGHSTAQGPSKPVITKIDESTPPAGHEGDRRYMSLFVEARDDDGWIRRIVVDWGDGTTQTFGGDPHDCQQNLAGWPATSHAWLPHDPPPAHFYPGGGTRTITATAYSTACDGSETQAGSASFVYKAY